MKWASSGVLCRWLLVVVLGLVCVVTLAQKIGDPYKILGIHPKATLPEIRKAYKRLAKEWHPDKNVDPEAESRFVEIKQAYELLSDKERRQRYDSHGITNEDDYLYRQRHDYSKYGRFSNDPFEEFFSSHFRTQDQDITLFHKLSVTTKHFENNIQEKSVHTPALVFFYTDWCFDCVRQAAAWRRLVDAMEPLGVTVATVHAAHESALARRIGIHGVPALTLVLDKHVYIYKESISAISKVLEFIRWKFPYHLVRELDDVSAAAFLSDFEDNRVKALVFERRQTMRLRYLIAAFHYRQRVSFGFVDTSAPNTANITSRFKIQKHMDSMVLMKEDSQEPAASVSTQEIPSQTLHQLINANQLLTLPRLSEQGILDTLCPTEWRPARRSLCCVLIQAGSHLNHVTRMSLTRLAKVAPPRLRYAYLYSHEQQPFLQALANASGMESSSLDNRVVVLWRRDTHRMQYSILANTWPQCPVQSCADDDAAIPVGPNSEQVLKFQQELNETKRALEEMVHHLLKSHDGLAYEALVQELSDASPQPWFWSRWVGAVRHWAARGDVWGGAGGGAGGAGGGAGKLLSALTAALTAAAVMALAHALQRHLRLEEESIQKQKEERRKQNANNAANKKNNNDMQSELRLHELRAEKYNGLVRLVKPGCRTIVLLVDMQSRVQLLSRFHKILWPYRKNKTLQFAYLMVERNMLWFSRVLQVSLGAAKAPQVNARNAVGTVLALNPHRNYFCIFHAKHPESLPDNKRMSKISRWVSGRAGDPEAGAFIGFDSDADSSADEPDHLPLLEENLLDGLDIWLDRLFEGSTHRYYVNYWPDMTTK